MISLDLRGYGASYRTGYQLLVFCMTFFFCYEGKSSKMVLTLNINILVIVRF